MTGAGVAPTSAVESRKLKSCSRSHSTFDGRHAAGLELCGVRGSAALCRACLGQCCRPTQNAEPNPFVFCRSVRNFQVRALARVPASPLRAASN